MLLADEIVVENLADFLRGRDAVPRFHQRGLALLVDDVLAQLDAFVANEHARPGNQLAHFVLALATERAVERTLRIFVAGFAHPCFPSIAARPAQNLYSTSLVVSVSPALSRAAVKLRSHSRLLPA